MLHNTDQPTASSTAEVEAASGRVQPSSVLHLERDPSGAAIVVERPRYPNPERFQVGAGCIVDAPAGGEFNLWAPGIRFTGRGAFVRAGADAIIALVGGGGEAGGHAQLAVERSNLQVREHARVEAHDRLDTPGNHASKLYAYDHAHLVLRGHSRVEAGGHVRVEAYDETLVQHASAHAMYGTIALHDRARLQWSGSYNDRFTVTADGQAELEISAAGGEVTVEASDEVQVTIRSKMRAMVTLRGKARAVVGSGCRVRAYDAAHVDAFGEAIVELHDAATCEPQGWDVQVRDQRAARPETAVRSR